MNDREEAIVATFSSHCQRFFASADPVSRAVVNAVERQDPTPPLTGDAAGFTAALDEMLGSAPLQELRPDLIERLRRAKNTAREEFHRENTQRQTKELEKLLVRASSSRTPLLDNGSGGGLSPTSLPSLRRFVAAHSTNVGAHPFLAGLARCLREQLGDNRCAIWTMEDEVLTQAGPGFAEAAVTVLVDGLGFEPDLSRSPDKAAGDDLESGGGGGSGRPWVVAAGLSDSDCEQLLRCLPKQSELYARPAGTMSKNANMVRVPRWDSSSGGGGCWQRLARRFGGGRTSALVVVGIVAATIVLFKLFS